MLISNYTNSTMASHAHLHFLTQIILSVLLATPAALSNLILLITIYRDPVENRLWRTPVTLLVVNLSVCDFLLGAAYGTGTLYYDIALFIGQTRENLGPASVVIVMVGVVPNTVSSCTIAAMSFDRFFVVSSPLQYRSCVTKAKIKVFIAVTWIYALLFACLIMGVSITVFSLLYCHLHVTLPLLILPVVYWKTYRALRLHNNQLQNVAGNRRGAMASAHRNRERKSVSAFLLVLVLFYVTLMPTFIAQNMLAVRPSLLMEESFKFFTYASSKFVLVNCSLNPFVYAWRIPNYRRAFKLVFCGRGCRNRSRNRVADGLIMMHSLAMNQSSGQPFSGSR